MRRPLYICVIAIVLAIPFKDCIAQVNGPAQPEFRKFQPVDLKDLVNEFTGSFTYSIPLITIPGPNGSDYPLTLNYTSGSSPNEAASWVGFGWNITTGAIIRNKKGWPDDYKNVNIDFINRNRPNSTASSVINYRIEYVSRDKSGEENPINPVEPDDFVTPSLSFSKTTSVCTLTGVYQQKGLTLGATGGFLKGANISASAMWDSKDNFSISGSANFSSYISEYILDRTGIQNNKTLMTYLGGTINRSISAATSTSFLGAASQYLVPSFGFQGLPTIFKPYYGISKTITPAVNLEIAQIKQEVDLSLGCMDLSTTTTKDFTAPVYGYMYSAEAEADKYAIMDYSVERDGNFELRDLYLGIPYSGADNFEVTGADVQGGFRLYQARVGCFRPNFTESITKIWGWGATFGAVVAPFGFNLGADGNEGRQVTRIYGWPTNKNSFYTGYWYNNPNKFFRFANDMGGSLLLADYNNDFSLYHSAIFDSVYLDIYYHNDQKWKEFQYLPQPFKSEYSGTSKLQSSQILYYTFGDYRNREYTNLGSFHNDRFYKQQIHEIKGVKDEIIAGYSVKGKNGYTYNYGLPVFNRNEMEYTYGLNNDYLGTNEHSEPVNGTYPPNVNNPLIVYKQLDTNNDNSRVANGQTMTEPYAGQFLLTEILTTDYVDLTNNGPTEDDLGGYVKFNYKRSTIEPTKEDDLVILNKHQPHDNSPNNPIEYNKQHQNWYRWRIPFNGLNYQKNSISDPQDDVGSMSSGESEIYYLESIETKTYVAYFITNKTNITINKNGKDTVLQGSLIERKDGFSASINEYLACSSEIGGCPASDSKNLLQFLERIELYSKVIKNPTLLDSDTAKIQVADLIQTTHFDYDVNYSAWPGQPNSLANEIMPNARLGKLTLKRVWSESGTAKDYKISPYVFGYTYPLNGYPSEFTDLVNYGKNFVAPGDASNPTKIKEAQQPYFSPLNTDRWGAYCSTEYLTNYGINSVSQMREGTYSFDPAAYNLKIISLPSGGEIHVQYEQNRYSYVQRNNACVLAPVFSTSGKMKEMTLDFDVESIFGCPSEKTNEIGLEVANIIRDKYVASPEDTLNHELSLLYCKFLFKQVIDGRPIPSDPLSDWNYEYVDGYIKPKSALYDQTTKKLKLCFNISDIGEKGRQFYKSNRINLIDQLASKPSSSLYDHEYRNENWAGDKATKYIYTGTADEPDDVLYNKFVLQNSYVRIPIPTNWSKLGGGIRVKRLLMLNRSNSPEFTSQSNLYGSEYIYEDENGKCSGVASNEPTSGREENALVNMLKTKSKSVAPGQYTGELSFTSGPRDLEQGEGPIGEYLLPGPSIGYSSVYQKSIIAGKRGNYIRNDGGIVRKQYYTTKDFPMLMTASDVMKTEKPFPSLTSLYSITIHSIRCSQGYRFILNNMNGQPKSVETYAGTIYKDENGNTTFKYLDKSPSSKTEYEYYDYMKPVPIYDGQLVNKYWGVDEEIITESRHIQDHYSNTKLEGDASFAGSFIPTSVSAGGQYSKVKTDLYMHVTNKILRMPVYLKSITTTTDGITKKVTQYGFDCNTGRALFTYWPNEFVADNANSLITNYVSSIQIPASQAIPGMQQSSSQRGGFVDGQFKTGGTIQVWRRIDYNQETAKSEYSLVFAFNTLPTGTRPDDSHPPDSTEEYLGGWESQYTKMYDPGDILKVIPYIGFERYRTSFFEDGNSSVGAEIYRVISQKGHIIKLEPLYSIPGKVYPSSKMISDVIIARKGSLNALNEDYASFITYGPDTNNYLQKINKEYIVDKKEIEKRNQFNDFLNYALYAATDAPIGTSYPMSQLLEQYSDVTNTPLSSLNWEFEGLEYTPTTISYSNIDKFFSLKGRSVDNCIIKDTINNITKTGVSVYHDTLRIYLLPNNTIAHNADLNSLSCPFMDLANAVIDSIMIMRLDKAMPDVNWEEILTENKPLKPEVSKRLLDIIGYSKVQNYALFFDSGDFRWVGNNLGESYKRGEDIFQIDANNITVQKLGADGITIKDISCKVKNNKCQDAKPFHLDPSNPDPSLKFRLGFESNKAKLLFSDVNIGTVYSNKSTIPPDTVTIKLFWSKDHKVIANDLFKYPDYNSLKVFLYDPATNNFSLYYEDSSPDIKRYYGDGIGTDSLTKEIVPRSWFWGDLSALKFSVKNDTLVDKSEFAVKGANRLISATVRYFDDNWSNPDHNIERNIINSDDPFRTGEKGKFRLKAEYVYDDLIDDRSFNIYNTLPTPIPSAIITDAKIYKAFQYPTLDRFVMFNSNTIYRDSLKDNWQKNIEITKRLPDGRIVEFVDNNEIMHTLFYGYPALEEENSQNPYIVKKGEDFISLEASNAGYKEVLYQPWMQAVSEENAHSGNCDSNFRSGAAYQEVLRGLKFGVNSLFDGVDYSKGLLSRVWVKDTASNPEGCMLKTSLIIYSNWPNLDASNSRDYDMYKVCQTGEWSLYESEIRDTTLTNYIKSIKEPNNIIAQVSLRTIRSDPNSIVFDDFIIQPISSIASAYMYNMSDRRMATVLDANHFATYYSYNDVGEPDKVHKETLAGFRTVAQSEYNNFGVPRLDKGPMVPSSLYRASKNSDLENTIDGNDAVNSIKGLDIIKDDVKGVRLKKHNSQHSLDHIFFNDENPQINEYKENFDIFDLKLTPDGNDFKILNSKFSKDSLENFINHVKSRLKNEKGDFIDSIPDKINSLDIPLKIESNPLEQHPNNMLDKDRSSDSTTAKKIITKSIRSKFQKLESKVLENSKCESIADTTNINKHLSSKMESLVGKNDKDLILKNKDSK